MRTINDRSWKRTEIKNIQNKIKYNKTCVITTWIMKHCKFTLFDAKFVIDHSLTNHKALIYSNTAHWDLSKVINKRKKIAQFRKQFRFPLRDPSTLLLPSDILWQSTRATNYLHSPYNTLYRRGLLFVVPIQFDTFKSKLSGTLKWIQIAGIKGICFWNYQIRGRGNFPKPHSHPKARIF